MRILFLSTNLPVPPNNGQAIRSLSIIRALASSGHELHFVSFGSNSRLSTLEPLSSYCRRVLVIERALTNVSQGSDYYRRAICLASLKSFSFERFRHEPMRAQIHGELQTGTFDLILCDSLYVLANVPTTNVPIALNCHNVEHLIFGRYARVETNPLKRSYAVLEALLMRGVERRSCQHAALAMACSINDRNLLHELCPEVPIFIVPNAVDTESFEPNGHLYQDGAPLLLFQGSMDWYPNRDAVEFFARTILPLVRAECPEVRFLVAGRNPPELFVKEVSSFGVEFTGTIPDMRPYLEAATVVVVPLRMGSGTRIKILEACAAGKPVVSTTLGAEGLAFEPEKEIVLADEPVQLTRAVVTLLRDPARRQAIGSAARKRTEDRYSHAALKSSLDQAIADLPHDSAPTSSGVW
jgi:glycosyltransferase involved in cell wall biosynthesis